MTFQLGPVVGQMGSRVESVPVSITEAVGSDVDHVLAEVDAGDGALVALTAEVTRARAGVNSPFLVIGERSVNAAGTGSFDVVAHVSGIVPIILRTRSGVSTYSVSLTGTVHTIPHPIT